MKKILLVSESEAFLQRNAKLLGRRGLKLFDSRSGEEALNQHKEHNFDLIFSDIKLTDMCGVDFCSSISKSDTTQQAYTILTCHNIKRQLERGEQSGASSIIIKPIDPTHLLNAVGSFLEVQLDISHRAELRDKVLCKTQALEFIGLSRDISTTGILMETEHQLELDSSVTCELTLPSLHKINAMGKVIRSIKAVSGTNLYGIRFIDIRIPSQREIFNYINSTLAPASLFHNTSDGLVCNLG